MSDETKCKECGRTMGEHPVRCIHPKPNDCAGCSGCEGFVDPDAGEGDGVEPLPGTNLPRIVKKTRYSSECPHCARLGRECGRDHGKWFERQQEIARVQPAFQMGWWVFWSERFGHVPAPQRDYGPSRMQPDLKPWEAIP